MALTQKEYRERSLQRRKQKKLCISCGEPLDRDGVRCKSCNEKHNKKNTEIRYWHQSNKICPRCAKNTLYGDEKTCPECNAYEYAINMQSRERLGKEHYNKVHREWAKNEHKKRIEKGICTRCGKRKADYGYKTCGICRAKIRNYKREKSTAENRQERYSIGLCFFCDNPILDGYKVCKKHYEINMKNLQHPKCKRATEKIKADNEKFFRKSI